MLGRAYCSVVCPLGILQDVFGALLFWRKNRPQPRLFLLRKGLGVAVWAIALLGGWAIGLRFLDPYTIFGAIAAYGWLPALVLLALVAWRRRFFCNSFCPVGALLACTSAHAPFGLRFTERCVKCGKCVTVCPAGCLDPKAGTIDNGRWRVHRRVPSAPLLTDTTQASASPRAVRPSRSADCLSAARPSVSQPILSARA